MTDNSTNNTEPIDHQLIGDGVCVSCGKKFEPPEADKRKIITLYSAHIKDTDITVQSAAQSKTTTVSTTFDDIQKHTFELCPECNEKGSISGCFALATGPLGFILYVILGIVGEVWRDAPVWLLRALQIPTLLLVAIFILSIAIFAIQKMKVNAGGKSKVAVSKHRQKTYKSGDYRIFSEKEFQTLIEQNLTALHLKKTMGID